MSFESTNTLTQDFYSNVCCYCKLMLDVISLQKCSGCKLVPYCSREHQKLDWYNHKGLCRSVQLVLKKSGQENIFLSVAPFFPDNENDVVKSWARIRATAMCSVESNLTRQLLPIERQIFFFPLVCSICLNPRLKPSEVCCRCHSVFFCATHSSSISSPEHLEICPYLEQCFIASCCKFNVHDFSDKMSLVLPGAILPEGIKDFIEYYLPFDLIDPDIKFVLSDYISCVSTLLFVLEKLYAPLTRLSLHIVGASVFDLNLLICIEILLHWISSLTEISIHLIGPDTLKMDKTELKLCVSCFEKLDIHFSDKLYHDYCKSDEYNIPDVIMAFNCGLHEKEAPEMNEWLESIPFLLQGKMFAMTSYTYEESCKDLETMKRCKAFDANNFSITTCQNPFRSYRPYRDWETFPSVYYQNNFITMISSD